jgi:serine/threonine-protein kinase
MAVVYLAHDRKLDRRVALKVLRPELASSLGPERFLRETEIAAKLTHPSILALFDRGEADGLLYYTMPYVDGESLSHRLTRERQLPIEDALRITKEVAEALEHAHSQGIVHRDIKPDNILFEGGHAVVADFGIARAIDVAGGDRLTETGLAVGTPAYMSPEQAGGVETVDARSDQYALACVLYEMLAGEPPFPGASAQAIMARKIAEPPHSVRIVRRTVPEGVEQVLQRALETSAADRYATVEEFAQALEKGVAAPSRKAVAQRVMLGVTVLVVLIGALVLGLRPNGADPRPPRTAIAVLPFENRTIDESQAYLASGLHDEVLTQLMKVAALHPISRTSVLGYAQTTKPLDIIAAELGVGTIVEGSVQVEGERLLVNVRLIDVETGEPLWAERYERTLDDAFAIQSAVAQQIVSAVGAALTETEATAIAAEPTDNPEAYNLYLQGEQYRRRPGDDRGNLEIAQQLFERALSLDPDFALARAQLSMVHASMFIYRYDPSPGRLEQQREEAEAALRLAPDLPQAHAAMGRVRYHQRDFPGALGEFTIALQGAPGEAHTWRQLVHLHRALGNWDEALAAFDSAAQLDPRDAHLFLNSGGYTYWLLRRYDEAVRALDRALVLAPDLDLAAVSKGWVYFMWRGELDTLRTVLNRLPLERQFHYGGTVALLARFLRMERRADSLLSLLAAAPSQVIESQTDIHPTSLWAAWAHRLRGDELAARAAFDSALVLLDSVMMDMPHDYRVHAARGLALAGLGRREEAIGEAQWLEQSALYREDAFFGELLAERRAWILAQAGEATMALDEIERMLAGPNFGVSSHVLRLDPLWDPIRDHPRFQELLVQYAEPQPVR